MTPAGNRHRHRLRIEAINDVRFPWGLLVTSATVLIAAFVVLVAVLQGWS